MFYQIWAMSGSSGVPPDRESFSHLLNRWYRDTGRTLQAVHPRDILRIVVSMCEYEGVPLQLSPSLVDEACDSYFVGSA